MCTSEPHVKIVHNRIDLDYTAELIVNGEVVVSKRYLWHWAAAWRGKVMLRKYLKGHKNFNTIIRESDL